MTDPDLVSPDLQQLLQLFAALPEGVRFPGLEPTALQEQVVHVKELHREVQELEAKLELARQALDEEQESLLKKGHRLRAYLEVYAEPDEALAAKVAALSLPKVRRAPSSPRPVDLPVAVDGEVAASLAPAPKKRGRPRKVQATDALFAEPALS